MGNNIEEQYFGKYLEKLKKAEREMLEKINELLEGIDRNPENAPAEHIRSRIKNPDSIREKLGRQGRPADCRSALTFLSDIIGVRIVTHFIGDVYTVLEELEKNSGWEIVAVKDYIANPKPNGYRSLHVILKLPFQDEEMPFILTEIQIRTIAMDCWASLEHQLKYKKSISDTELIVSELKRCADEIASTDLTMQTIREMLRA